jgi:hypothetical protein
MFRSASAAPVTARDITVSAIPELTPQAPVADSSTVPTPAPLVPEAASVPPSLAIAATVSTPAGADRPALVATKSTVPGPRPYSGTAAEGLEFFGSVLHGSTESIQASLAAQRALSDRSAECQGSDGWRLAAGLVSFRNDHGATALHAAAEAGNAAVVQQLVHAGASVHIADNAGAHLTPAPCTVSVGVLLTELQGSRRYTRRQSRARPTRPRCC